MDADRDAVAGDSGGDDGDEGDCGGAGDSGSTIATTQVTDTVYRADGTPAAGTVIVSWQAFTTASGQAVPSGTHVGDDYGRGFEFAAGSECGIDADGDLLYGGVSPG